MEQINVKRGRGRPLKYSTEEERIEAIRKNKANYRAKQRGENQIIIRGRPKMYFTEEEKKQAKTRCMLNKEWCCDVCDGHNYILAGKHCHLKSMKHIRNVIENNIREKLSNIE